MAILKVSKPGFGTQKINSNSLKVYQEAGWSVIETPEPETPKEVKDAAKRGGKSKNETPDEQ